jgi:ankyrin repeat protein
MKADFDRLYVSGAIAQLQTTLCADLFALRSEAPIQDALAHSRPDVAEHLLQAREAAEGIESARSMLAMLDATGRTALEVALVCDEFAAATKLLARGAPVDAMASGGEEPLVHLMCHGSDAAQAFDDHSAAARKLALLLEHGASVDAMNGRGESALDVALFHGGPAVVALLLRHRAKSMMATAEGGCLLHAAALARRSDVLEAALGCLATIAVDLNQQDRLGRTPLHVGVESGSLDLVAPLLRMRASTEVQSDDGSTPLRLAVSQGDLSLTRALLDVGAEKNALGADAVPLIVLAAETSADVATTLVGAAADLNQTDASGRSALEVAVSKGEYALCELLLTKGGRPTNRKDAAGNTSLHIAVERRADELVRLLVRHKAELSEQNRKGQTPLIIGAESGQSQIVELLLHSGASLHLVDASSRSALELALSNGHLGVLRILLQQSIVDVNGITKRGSSLLHLASEIGEEQRVTFLLEMGAMVDVLNANGETPLHWACSLGHLAVVRALVHFGANTMLHERVQGLTPLHAACGSRGQPAVLALLIQRCEAMAWNGQPQRCNLLDINRNTPLHTSTRLAVHAAKYMPILLEHGANPNLSNAQGQNVLHLLAERAVREQQERSAVNSQPKGTKGGGEGAAGEGVATTDEGEAPPVLPALRLLELLAEHKIDLDAQELETGNTALHHAAFGGCIDLAVQLVRLGASVGLPNRDGFTPLDSSYRSETDPTQSLQSLLLSQIQKPMSWTPDRMVSACQSCKLPFNKADPKMARKHHCRHCGRCVCQQCSQKRMAIPKFDSRIEERVCLLCERVLT